jgi:hypothetical protein
MSSGAHPRLRRGPGYPLQFLSRRRSAAAASGISAPIPCAEDRLSSKPFPIRRHHEKKALTAGKKGCTINAKFYVIYYVIN